MKRVPPERLVALARLLSWLEHKDLEDDATFSESAKKKLRRDFKQYQILLEQLGLVMSLKQLRRIDKYFSVEKMKLLELRPQMKDFHERLTDEIEERALFTISPDKIHYYDGQGVFEEEVASAFPKALFDMEEAGKCFALSRNTAAVFHLMRVMECGLQALSSTMGVELDADRDLNWQTILDKCAAKLKTMKAGSEKKAFAEAVAQLEAVKIAWRNPTMHITKPYDEEKALDVFYAVRAFMRELANLTRKTA